MSRKHSGKKEMIARLDDIIIKKGFFTKDEANEIFEKVYHSRCNEHMNMCGGKNSVYRHWLGDACSDFLQDTREMCEIDENGNEKPVRRYVMNDAMKAYVWQYKLKKEEDVNKARGAIAYRTKMLHKMADSVENANKAVDTQEKKIQKEIEYRAWDNSNPALFPPSTGTDPQDQMR